VSDKKKKRLILPVPYIRPIALSTHIKEVSNQGKRRQRLHGKTLLTYTFNCFVSSCLSIAIEVVDEKKISPLISAGDSSNGS